MNLKKPFFIAEISANHCGKFKIAKKLIKCAKVNGADAVKLQTFTPETMTLKSNKSFFKIKSGIWKGYDLWSLYDKAKTPLDWHKKLFTYGKKIGIQVFSTPFDESSVDFLEELKCPIYKVSSFEMTDLSLIKKIALTKKPIIISTGTASLEEIKMSFNIAKKYGSKDITLLYCVSNYPSQIKDFNLNNIKILKNLFKCKVGLSDHSLDNKIAVAAISCGAEVIEKHIALKNQKQGLDINFSLRGDEIKILRNEIDTAYKILGKDYFYRSKSENNSKKFRRSLFAVRDIQKGDKFSSLNIKKIRPGYGISCAYYETLLNKKSPFLIKAETPISKTIIHKLKLKLK